MHDLATVAPAFVEMAHQIVWCSAATVDEKKRPRSRVLHPMWEWSDGALKGWIATGPTPMKRAHLKESPYLSLNYWAPNQDTCVAECSVTWAFDDDTRVATWERFKNTPPPVGYHPAIIPGWTEPTDDSFAVLLLTPWRLRVFPGSVLMGQGGEVLTWVDR
jgi:hypothetical protein